MEWNHFLGCDEEPHQFGLGCGGHDKLDNVGDDEDQAIDGRLLNHLWKT